MIKAVLFDLDGTLVNSLFDLSGAVNYVLNGKGYPTHSAEEFKYFVGDGIPKMVERALPEQFRNKKITEECVSDFMAYYSEHFYDRTVPYDGIPEALKTIAKMGLGIAVVSNKAQGMAEKVVKTAFGERISVIIGKQDAVPPKPAPKSLLIAAEMLSVKPSECAFLGDSGMDMAAASAAGMLPVGVLWGFREENELKANGALKFLNAPDEIIELIEVCKNE